MYNPEKDELENWIRNPITQWWLEEVLDKFDPHKRILLSKPEDYGEVKGEQTVCKYLRNPLDLL